MTITLNALQKQRRDTASNWASNNPTLLAGEFGYETDTKKFKIGDGTTAYNSLAYLPIPDTNRLLAGDLTVGGNFTVNGTSTTIDTTTLTVEDKNIEIGKVSSPSDTTADGGGITLKAASDKTIAWSNANDSWDFNQNINAASTYAYRINNVSVLNATTLGSSVVNSSLTSVGTIATGVWQGTAIGSAYMTASSGSSAGSMSSADFTKLSGIEASADVTDATNVNAAGAIMESDVNAKGDLLAGTANNTVARLPVGTNGYVLKADSSASSGLVWAVDAGGIADVEADSSPSLGGDLASNGHNINIGDSGSASDDRLVIGAGSDLQIFHDGTHSYLTNATNDLNIECTTNDAAITLKANSINLKDENNQFFLKGIENTGAVELYHSNSKKFETTSTGVSIDGNISAGDNDHLYLGDSQDINIYSDGTDNYFYLGTGTTYFRNGSNAFLASFVSGGAIYLYHSGTKRLETTSSGASVTGNLAATGNVTAVNITASNDLSCKDLAISDTTPSISFTDTDNNPDFKIMANTGALKFIDSTNNNADRIVINSDGHVDVLGNLDVGSGLDVTGNITTTGTLDSGEITITGTVPSLKFTESDGNPDYQLLSNGGVFKIHDVTNSADRIQIQADGTVDILGNLDAQAGLDVTGAIVASGDITAFSDAKLKTEISTINDALSTVGKLRGVTYKWLKDGKPSIGVIAQEIEKVIPQIVHTTEHEGKDVKSVDYGKIVGVLIEAVKELKTEVDKLKGVR